jgi:hypothetical protein
MKNRIKIMMPNGIMGLERVKYTLTQIHEKANWRILTNKEICATVKKPTITEPIRLQRLCWFGHVQRVEENRIPKTVLYMNSESTRPRSRQRNRWQK